MFRKAIWTVLLVLVFLGGCASNDHLANEGESDEEEAPVPVEVSEVTKGWLDDEVTLSGNVMAGEDMAVLPMATGEIIQVHVRNGDTVERGDVLFELDASEIELNVAQARSGLESAKAGLEGAKSMRAQNIRQAELQLEQAKDQHEMMVDLEEAAEEAAQEAEKAEEESVREMEELLTEMEQLSEEMLEMEPLLEELMGGLAGTGSQGSQQGAPQPGSPQQGAFDVSQAEMAVEMAKIGLEQAQAVDQIEAAEASVRQAEISLEMAEQQLEHTVVQAPMSGQVSNLNVSAGEMASPQAPLLHLVNMDTPYVQINVNEMLLPELSIDQEVNVHIKTLNKTYDGTITYISPMPAEQSYSYPVEIALDDPDENLKIGMMAEVNLHISSAAEHVIVPVDALRQEYNEMIAYVTDDGKQVERRVVTIAEETSDWAAIESGLTEDEYIVTSGQHQLDDGAEINVRNENIQFDEPDDETEEGNESTEDDDKSTEDANVGESSTEENNAA